MKTVGIVQAQLDGIAEFLRKCAGLTFSPSRRADLDAAVQKVMTVAGIADADVFLHHLAINQRLFDTLIAQVTVDETYLFREPEQFEWLRRQILPKLRERQDTKLHFWSAGCASGEEAYSLAILADQEGLAERTSILGTDLSRAALARARQASFRAWSMRAAPADVVAHYFQNRGGRHELVERLRRTVTFAYLNLADDCYPSFATDTANLDVIFCRNVLIYLDREAVEKVAQRLFQALRVGGWLLTGPSDPPLWQLAPFETVVTPAGVLYRRGESAAIVTYAPWRPAENERAAEPVRDERPKAPSTAGTIVEAPRTATGVPEPAGSDRWIARIRALADRGDLYSAERAVIEAMRLHPLSAELHYLRAIILVGLGRYEEAATALRRVLYLDRSLAMAHFTLATILRRQGALAEARRCYRSAVALCAHRPGDEIVPLSDGECCDRLAAAAQAHLALLDAPREAVS